MDHTHAAMRCQLAVLDEWKERYGNITIDELRTYLNIGLNPRQSQIFHEKDLEISHSTMGRYMSLLGDKGHANREGMGLTSQEVNPTYWREALHSLTLKGKAVSQSLARHFDRYRLLVEELEGGGLQEQEGKG